MDVHVTALCTKGVGVHESARYSLSVPFVLMHDFQILHENGFPVPKPIDQARHCILMELIDAYPL
jgi:RIO-like serine/threonine protein kinase